MQSQQFDAIVTDIDQRGARIQLCSEPVVARIRSKELRPGAALTVRLESADPATRSVQFSVVS